MDPLAPNMPELEDASRCEREVDRDCMEAVKKGDKAALSTLYDKYSASVFATCLRILRQEAEAEAVVSDVFYEIWRKPHGFDALKGSCRTYLLIMARSRSLDRLRASAKRAKKHRGAGREIASTSRAHRANEPYMDAVAMERRALIREAINRIDPDQREALALAYFSGLTHPEVAEELGLPIGTVKSRIRRGLFILKSSLRSLEGTK